MAGIYIHIPFCKKKCSYCDFHFSTTFEAYRKQMIAALCAEIRIRMNHIDAPKSIKTLYFGGGTPSLLHESELKLILDALGEFINFSDLEEFTIEANPDDLDEEHLSSWKVLGFNRLSIGVQSFDDADLKWMNRAHNAHESHNSIQLAQQFGFHNLTIDLMYGLPNQTLASWEKQLDIALALNVSHISSYCLTVEERTALRKFVDQGVLSIPDEDLIAQQFELLVAKLESNNFEHYEISNFAKAGARALHNSNYWRGEHYLGIGPSAHGFDGNSRYWNVANNPLYIKQLKDGELPETLELLTPQNKFNELIMTGLRTSWGVDFEALNRIVKVNPDFVELLNALKEKGEIEWLGSCFRLTKKAKLRADYYASTLFI